MWITHDLYSSLPIRGTDFPAQWEKSNKHTRQGKDRGRRELGFLIICRRGDFFSFPSLISICLWNRITILPADSVHQDIYSFALFFLCYNPENSISPKAESQHPCGRLLFFGIKRKMNSPVRKCEASSSNCSCPVIFFSLLAQNITCWECIS